MGSGRTDWRIERFLAALCTVAAVRTLLLASTAAPDLSTGKMPRR